MVLLILAWSLFVISLATFCYAVLAFLKVVVNCNLAILHVVSSFSSILTPQPTTTSTGARSIFEDRLRPSDGGFEAASDEELFVAEQERLMKLQGYKDGDIDAFIKHGVTEKE